MDFCRNLSVSGGLPTEYPSEQVISPAYSTKHNGNNYSLDDLFPIQNTEGDVSLEWLSAFVEDCLSSTGSCIPVPTIHTQTNPTTVAAAAATITAEIPEALKPSDEKPHRNQPSLHEFSIPGKARSKRKRSPTTTIPSLTTFSHLHSKAQGYHVTASDPPLLHQAYWLADSELIVPKKMNNNTSGGGSGGGDGDDEEVVMMMMGGNNNNSYNKDKLGGSSSSSSSMESSHGQPRRCTHCLSQRTPQWRAGPLGPKTLCNACGVRYKSGRLLPEYRPAKSPTFVSYKHSNSHKKVLEMRMSISSSDE